MSQSAAKPFSAEVSAGGPAQFEYLIERFIGKAYVCRLVRVDTVAPGDTGPVGFLSATDLLQQVDGSNQGIPNVSMENIPYFRLQGGANAIIIDPKPGDIGLAMFADRDISETKRSKAEGPPPSLRAHDVSDGLYIGGILNGAPSQWLRFLDSGVHIQSTGELTVDATVMQVNCPIVSTGDITDHTSSMQGMRNAYNPHTHPGGGEPSNQMV